MAVPASVRGLVGVAIAVFTLPLVLGAAKFGFRFSIANTIATACLVPCAVALACARPNGFRSAIAVAGCAVGPAAVCAGIVLLLGGFGFGRPDAMLLGIALPIAAIALLAAAFQRARGAEYGRRPAALGWSAAALSAVCRPLLIFV
ncbi:hypothetical protein [Streptomyces sp. LS1784]|uniref:hypothetical protein n=1 Tax=Streptomyces sp. LS1784 TaxID=2851533 RepID=UPI001CCF23FE|nr:hypothetical protein [Streptomyces sp. LS1784]